MSGERDLAKLRTAACPVLDADTWVYCCFVDSVLPKDLFPVCIVQEKEGLTAIIKKIDAQQLLLPFTFEARLITLAIHSSLEAVGFLATIATAFAVENIPCNVIAGYFHDHLLVPVEKADQAMEVLKTIAQ